MMRRFARVAAVVWITCCALQPIASMASTSATVRAHIQISVCGNAHAEGGEECDVTDLNGKTCQSLGFGGGTLACAVDCSFDTAQCVAGGGSSGGGGSGPSPVVQPVVTQVVFSGQAYPSSRVTLLKDGQIAAIEIADGTGRFTATLRGLSGGAYQFSVYANDAVGRRSAPLSFPLEVAAGMVTRVSEIAVAPTVEVEDAGDGLLTVRGQGPPNAFVYDVVDGQETSKVATVTDEEGNYLFQLDAGSLAAGRHEVSVAARSEDVETAYGAAAEFEVAAKASKIEVAAMVDSDLNGDRKINLVDFSILAYWFHAAAPPARADLNHDGKVDLTDFSIMAYYWSG